MRRSIDIEILRKLIAQVHSWGELALVMGVKSAKHLTHLCHKHQIDFSHFHTVRKLHIFGRGPDGRILSLAEYLKIPRRICSSVLRKRLILEGVKSEKCEACGIDMWRGQKAPLQLHHIDGNHENNQLENLQILCCNCHALTPNYCAARSKRGKKSVGLEEYKAAISISHSLAEVCRRVGIQPQGGNVINLKKLMNEHGLKLLPKPQNVSVPSSSVDMSLMPLLYKTKKTSSTKVKKEPITKRPPREVLEKLIWEKPLVSIGEDFTVVDNTVKKWCERYSLRVPPRGYWIRRRAGYCHEDSLVSQEKKRKVIPRMTIEKFLLAKDLLSRGLSKRKAAQSIGFHKDTLQYHLEQEAILRTRGLDYNPES